MTATAPWRPRIECCLPERAWEYVSIKICLGISWPWHVQYPMSPGDRLNVAHVARSSVGRPFGSIAAWRLGNLRSISVNIIRIPCKARCIHSCSICTRTKSSSSSPVCLVSLDLQAYKQEKQITKSFWMEKSSQWNGFLKKVVWKVQKLRELLMLLAGRPWWEMPDGTRRKKQSRIAQMRETTPQKHVKYTASVYIYTAIHTWYRNWKSQWRWRYPRLCHTATTRYHTGRKNSCSDVHRDKV